MLKLRRRLLVYASDSERVPFFLHRERALTDLRSGRVIIEAKDASGTVIAVRLVAEHKGNMEDASPGSFGVNWERIVADGGHGGLVFSHKPTHERLLAGA